MNDRLAPYVRLGVLFAVILYAAFASASAQCNCSDADCYEIVVVAEAGIDVSRGTYEFTGMVNGRPAFENQQDVIIRYDPASIRWKIETDSEEYYESRITTADTPPSTGWTIGSHGDGPYPRLAGGDICEQPTGSPEIDLFSHSLNAYTGSGYITYRDNFMLRSHANAAAFDIVNSGTGVLRILTATITAVNCTVEIQEEFPLLIRPGEHPGIRPYFTVSHSGPFSASIVLHNNSLNEPAFVIGIKSEPFDTSFVAEPAGTAGTILDQGLPPGYTPPVDGPYKAVTAIYDFGDLITGALRIEDLQGNPIPDFEAQFSLVNFGLAGTEEYLCYSSDLVYDPDAGVYRFSFDTATQYGVGWQPVDHLGFYDVRVALPDGTEMRAYVEIR